MLAADISSLCSEEDINPGIWYEKADWVYGNKGGFLSPTPTVHPAHNDAKKSILSRTCLHWVCGTRQMDALLHRDIFNWWIYLYLYIYIYKWICAHFQDTFLKTLTIATIFIVTKVNCNINYYQYANTLH